MALEIKYQGRVANTDDVAFIKRMIAENPGDSRRGLSKKLCEAWNWVQPNGALRDMECRGFLLQLHRGGYIKLPARKFTPNNPFVNRKSPSKVRIDQTEICTRLSKLQPLEIRQVRRTSDEKLFNSGNLRDAHKIITFIVEYNVL